MKKILNKINEICKNYEKFASGVLDFTKDSFKIKKDDFKEE